MHQRRTGIGTVIRPCAARNLPEGAPARLEEVRNTPAAPTRTGPLLHRGIVKVVSLDIISHDTSLPNQRSHSDTPSVPSQDEGAVPPRFVTALLLAWAASRGRSLFAARCLVSAALELYARGATVDDVQLALSFAGEPYLYVCGPPRDCDARRHMMVTHAAQWDIKEPCCFCIAAWSTTPPVHWVSHN